MSDVSFGSPARALLQGQFDELTTPADIWPRLDGSTETSHLEFKQKADPRTPELGDSDKQHFSKAVSSFSNSDGGLLVWGIRTVVTGGVERANRFVEIAEVEVFAERLRSCLLETTTPVNQRVVVKALAGENGAGAVVCLIPAGDSVPYRSSRAGEREYWVRMDGRNARMEHFQIRDMMVRASVPALSVHLDPVDGAIAMGRLRFDAYVVNTGRAIAKHGGFHITTANATFGLVAGELRDESPRNTVGCVMWSAGLAAVVHPHAFRLAVGSFELHFDPTTGADLAVHVYCEGMSMTTELLPLRP